MPEYTKADGLYVYQCGEQACEPGHSFGPAMRDHWLIHWVFGGKGILCRGGQTLTVCAGQCFLIRPGEVTFYKADDRDPWHYIWIGFSGREAEKVLETCGLPEGTVVRSFSQPVRLMRQMRRLIRYYRCGDHSFAVQALLYAVLDTFCDTSVPVHRTGSAFARIEDCLRRNYSYPLTVQTLAQQVHLDRSQLYRVVKKETGLSPQQYLVAYRLRESQRLLLTTALSVTEIMYSVGFEDLSGFSRCFRRMYGVSPRQYREREREKEALRR